MLPHARYDRTVFLACLGLMLPTRSLQMANIRERARDAQSDLQTTLTDMVRRLAFTRLSQNATLSIAIPNYDMTWVHVRRRRSG